MAIISISNLSKVYGDGTNALDEVNLEVKKGEIIALLGPNGAGKTTLISTICGLLTHESGEIKVDGYDTVTEYRKTRRLIGLVPQEIMLEPFETVYDTVRFTRGLFGYPENRKFLEDVLQKLSLWDKRKQMIKELSGGMKRRVMIAKALSHNPKILFLDEPTAGVDVELRREMWSLVDLLKSNGVTILLTTHYIEEAEMMADRIALIDKGTPVIVVAPDDHLKEKTLSSLQECRARGARIALIHTEGDSIAEYGDVSIPVPRSSEIFSPLLTVLPLQLLSYRAGLALNRDIDRPRNLAKSVTVE